MPWSFKHHWPYNLESLSPIYFSLIVESHAIVSQDCWETGVGGGGGGKEEAITGTERQISLSYLYFELVKWVLELQPGRRRKSVLYVVAMKPQNNCFFPGWIGMQLPIKVARPLCLHVERRQRSSPSQPSRSSCYLYDRRCYKGIWDLPKTVCILQYTRHLRMLYIYVHKKISCMKEWAGWSVDHKVICSFISNHRQPPSLFQCDLLYKCSYTSSFFSQKTKDPTTWLGDLLRKKVSDVTL